MSVLLLVPSPRASLTKTTLATDPNNPTGPQIATTFECDIEGNPLNGAAPLYVYRDQFTGKSYVRLCEVAPSGNQSSDKATRDAINSLNPIHYSDSDSNVRGWYVEAPDFNSREPITPVAVAPPVGKLAPQVPAPTLGVQA